MWTQGSRHSGTRSGSLSSRPSALHPRHSGRICLENKSMISMQRRGWPSLMSRVCSTKTRMRLSSTRQMRTNVTTSLLVSGTHKPSRNDGTVAWLLVARNALRRGYEAILRESWGAWTCNISRSKPPLYMNLMMEFGLGRRTLYLVLQAYTLWYSWFSSPAQCP